MARKPALHSADELLSPAIERMVAATDPPDSDAPLLALARVIARTVDRMTDAERAAMLGQTGPLVLKVLQELETRDRRRRAPARPRAVNPVHSMREGYAKRFGA
jgi:hypothetical protein